MSASYKTYRILILISISFLPILALVDRDPSSIADVSPLPVFARIFLI